MKDPLKEATQNLKFRSVDLASCNVEVRELIDWKTVNSLDSDTTVQGYRLVESMNEAQYDLPNSENGEKGEAWGYDFKYVVGTRLIFDSEEDQSNDPDFSPIFRLEAKFLAKYISYKKIDNECLEAFSSDNVGYHVWPYWREIVQSFCNRVGLYPPISVEVYRLENQDVSFEEIQDQ